MERSLLKIFFLLILILLLSFIIFSQKSFATSPEEYDKILNLIADFAIEVCPKTETIGKENKTELVGDAKTKLKGFIKKLADAKFAGAVKYQQSEYEGPLRKDLTTIIEKSLDCRKDIAAKLIDKLLINPSKDKSSN